MSEQAETTHRKLERKMGTFTVLTTVAILIGGAVELIPMFTAQPSAEVLETIKPMTPLELAGRDIYVREGCYNCHSQMVRPLRSEVMRWGEWSRSWEFTYDRPFQFGSRRIGPDLHRVAGRYNDAWHYEHMRDPRSTSPGSVMPGYPWLLRDKIEVDDIAASVGAMRALGVPYQDGLEVNLRTTMEDQASHILDDLAVFNIEAEWDDEIIATIAYLQSLGRYRPMYPDLEGVELGQALFEEMRCRRCHGDGGTGGVGNPNYGRDTIPALNVLASNMGLDSQDEASAVIEALLSGQELSAVNPQGVDNWPNVASQLETYRNVVRHGQRAAKVDPDGPEPNSMPPWRNILNDQRIDAVLAYLIDAYPWEAQ